MPSEPRKRFVIYRDAFMVEGWPERIQRAQSIRTYRIGGRDYPRIPYGKEGHDWRAEAIACHDCKVIAGELHVPSCDVEECPACHEQSLTCGCVEHVDD